MYQDTDKELSGKINYLAGGDPQEREPGSGTPCHICPKVPEGRRTADSTYRDAIEPTERSRAILTHYYRCKAVGRFPLDMIVEEHAGQIAEIEAAVANARAQHSAGLLGMLLPTKVGS